MSVETRKDSKFWYGRWQENGQRRSKQLGTLVVGEPGSEAFDESKSRAEEELQALLEQARIRQRPEDLVQRLHHIKFGSRIGSIPLTHIFAEWSALPRPRPITRGRIKFAEHVLKSFTDFMRGHYPHVKEMAAVTPEMAEKFMLSEEKRKITGRTYNARLALLRGTFERLRIRAGMLGNPFKENLVLKTEDSVPRQPFTIEELQQLFKTAQEHDQLVYGLIVLGACTALRRGDACCLKWDDIDLRANHIRVTTRKTGEKVSIPILPLLRQVLTTMPRIDEEYVFPTMARTYLSNPSAVNDRLNRVFRLAGFRPDELDAPRGKKSATVDIPAADDLRPSVITKIRALTVDQVSDTIKAHMLQVFDLYSSGTVVADIAQQLKMSKGSVSNYIDRIEKAAGHPIIRRQVKAIQDQRVAQDSAKEHPVKPLPRRGKIRTNTRGFHALRATFITQALAAGVPVEVVKMISGHSATETVLRHYFNPDEKTVFNTIRAAMPRLLTLGA